MKRICTLCVCTLLIGTFASGYANSLFEKSDIDNNTNSAFYNTINEAYYDNSGFSNVSSVENKKSKNAISLSLLIHTNRPLAN